MKSSIKLKDRTGLAMYTFDSDNERYRIASIHPYSIMTAAGQIVFLKNLDIVEDYKIDEQNKFYQKQ